MDSSTKLNNFRSHAPDWMKLDNAATIYPTTLSRKFAAMFRASITLQEKIDPSVLSVALNNVMKRFPSFSYCLRYGLFWCYFSRIKGAPPIQEDVKNPMCRIKWKNNNYFMFRIRYFEKRIAVEFFHALTDGTGGITFLLTLVAEYLKIKYNCKIAYQEYIFDPNEVPNKEEYEDSFKKYSRKIGSLEKEYKAYHVPGINEDSHLLNIITGKIPIPKLKKETIKYNCTITEFLVSIMILSIQQIQEKENKKGKKHPIKISVPINLRKIYPSKTLRNFSSYVNVGIDTKYGHYTLEEIIKRVKSEMGIMITEKKLNAKITANVKLAQNYLIRCIPMFIKKPMLSISEYILGDRCCSNTLSNIGIIKLPKEMEKHVSKLDLIIGRSRSKPGSCACISYNNNLYISFSRKIKESEMEKIFFTTLIEMGIPVEVESNQRR